MSWRVLRAAFASGVVAAVAVPACGGNSSNPGSPAGGSGGEAGAGEAGTRISGSAGSTSTPPPIACGKATCTAVLIPVAAGFAIPPCCADAAANSCGLDSSVLASFGPTFPEACQPLAQPGVEDKACPDSVATPVAGTGLMLSFHGCCRPTGQCGYLLDDLGGVIPLGLGCVDSSPFLDGGAPASCGDNAGGEGGVGGAGPGVGASGEGGVAGTPAP
ncbi:MAG: hypothetical protein ABI548_02275 [Polyangiaceae bacterium]